MDPLGFDWKRPKLEAKQRWFGFQEYKNIVETNGFFKASHNYIVKKSDIYRLTTKKYRELLVWQGGWKKVIYIYIYIYHISYIYIYHISYIYIIHHIYIYIIYHISYIIYHISYIISYCEIYWKTSIYIYIYVYIYIYPTASPHVVHAFVVRDKPAILRFTIQGAQGVERQCYLRISNMPIPPKPSTLDHSN